MEKKRSTFTGRIGFVLAAAGSAVGLGNIWRFPYLAAKYGGGTFLIVYIILAISFGFALMVTEIAIGRKTGLSVIGAYKKLDKRFSLLGWLAAAVPIIIFPYYCVIGGWVTKYGVTFATNQMNAAAQDGYFGSFISNTWEPLGWFALFIALTALIVLLGVKDGIERASKILMPLLVVMTIGICIFVMCQPGALDGVLYYFTPTLDGLNVNMILAALGQLFYSMSLAMGIMITYGSYMKKDVDIEKSAKQIEIFDIGIAVLAGLMIVPSVFVFSGGDLSKLQAGPSLMFITLPQVFQNMWGGQFVGTLFFVLVLFAALTSSVSLMETIVSIITDKTKLKRQAVCLIVLVCALLVGIPSSLGFGIWSDFTILGMSILDFFDFISNSVMMPIVALFTCLLVGYFVGVKTIGDEVKLSSKFKREKMYNIITKYIAPIFILAILISSVLNSMGVIKL
ncbi:MULTISPECIES: sodium-dependent transporter [unclassified Ruminococcus]|uniref:sodium-dependent transporter n=1 Tax=unclassified Ruminococcus TaxID=2608920 RepID=UPI00210AE25B|nr:MULTISPECIES: sodium-dependent transporter [unclassified Ruminococcus]MCQ4022288.1 sodium-dependent transporter [Ruminococcus sp. zg-924]MCQ4114616.1 sodium-dependent transporter [Ruminococcus sp. zg-921]